MHSFKLLITLVLLAGEGSLSTCQSMRSYGEPGQGDFNIESELKFFNESLLESRHSRRQLPTQTFYLGIPSPDTNNLQGDFWLMIQWCVILLNSAVYWSGVPTDGNMQFIFGNSDPAIVQQRLQALQGVCSQTKRLGIEVYLDESVYLEEAPVPSRCSAPVPEGISSLSKMLPGYAMWESNAIVLCPAFYSVQQWSNACYQLTQAGWFTTLLAQLPGVMGFGASVAADSGTTYGNDITRIQDLSGAADQADAYRLYSQQSALRCVSGSPQIAATTPVVLATVASTPVWSAMYTPITTSY